MFLRVPWATECRSLHRELLLGVSKVSSCSSSGLRLPRGRWRVPLLSFSGRQMPTCRRRGHSLQTRAKPSECVHSCLLEREQKTLLPLKTNNNNSRLWVLWDDPRESFRISLDPKKQSFWNWAAGFRIQRAGKNPNTCIIFPGHWIKISWSQIQAKGSVLGSPRTLVQGSPTSRLGSSMSG